MNIKYEHFAVERLQIEINQLLCKIEKIRIPKESPTRQNRKCCMLGLIEPVHGRQCHVKLNANVWCCEFIIDVHHRYHRFS
jgi:hypothetical protein